MGFRIRVNEERFRDCKSADGILERIVGEHLSLTIHRLSSSLHIY